MPERSSQAPTRRAVLGGAVLLAAAAGCRPFDHSPAADQADPDAALLAAAIAGERALLAAYDAALAAHPQLAGRLGPLRDDHAAHLAALTAAGVKPTATPTATPTVTPTATPPSMEPERDLAALEKGAAAGLLELCTRAGRAALAPLLASIGACEAGHAVTLAGRP